jgi:Coenzyme PQQ synthesis protein D (PqqD).
MKEKEKVNLFDVIPYISEHVTTEKEGDLSMIAFPRFRNKFMQKYFVPKGKSAKLHVKLEEHGTAVWNLIDGKRTVMEITELLADHFDHEENYQYRITTYISQLYSNGFIKYKTTL